MSMTAGLNKEDMTCWCPACGEIVEVYEDDLDSIVDDGHPEYWVHCPHCHQGFYVSEDYN